jgi:acetyl-CoA acetyltransferase
MTLRSLRGKAAIVGIGQSTYYRQGDSPDAEFALLLKAIKAACDDAGISPSDIQSFSSYSNDRNEPVRLSAALNCKELRSPVMVWGGGGGGMAGSIINAAAVVATGQADCVAAVRGLAQGQFGRFGRSDWAAGGEVKGEAAYSVPFGVATPGQLYALKYQRWMYEHGGVGMAAQKAISMASYHHAQQNPAAVMHGRPLTSEAYDAARWIVEPWRLYDFCQENDGAAALIIVPAERVDEYRSHPVYILAGAQGANHRRGARMNNSPVYPTSNFTTVAPRLWEMAELGPPDVDVVQAYENFSGAVVMTLVEHGLCDGEAVDEVFTLENLTTPGKLPLNTSGGNLAEAYIHGLNLAVEGVRQIRGESCNQVPGAKVCLVTGGPMPESVTDIVLASREVL